MYYLYTHDSRSIIIAKDFLPDIYKGDEKRVVHHKTLLVDRSIGWIRIPVLLSEVPDYTAKSENIDELIALAAIEAL